MGQLPRLQRMPVLSGVTVGKAGKDEHESKAMVSVPLEKQSSASFTFAERAPLQRLWGSRRGLVDTCSAALSRSEVHLLNTSPGGA